MEEGDVFCGERQCLNVIIFVLRLNKTERFLPILKEQISVDQIKCEIMESVCGHISQRRLRARPFICSMDAAHAYILYPPFGTIHAQLKGKHQKSQLWGMIWGLSPEKETFTP